MVLFKTYAEDEITHIVFAEKRPERGMLVTRLTQKRSEEKNREGKRREENREDRKGE